MLTATVQTQQVDRPAALRAQIDRIFKEHAYAAPRFGPARWLPDGTPMRSWSNPRVAPDPKSPATTRRPARAPFSSLVPPGAARPESTARHRRLRVVGGRQAAADLHQHAEGVAREHARRLLGARRRASGDAAGRSAAQAPRASSLMFAKFSPDAHARRLRPRQQHLRRAPRRRAKSRAHDGRIRDDDQRHVRLGLRGRARRPRRLPLEPGRPSHRLLAVRHDRRRHLLADQRHRHAVSDDHAHPVSEGRDHELRGAHRRGQRRRRQDTWMQDARRSARTLPRAARLDRREHRRDPAAESAAEPATTSCSATPQTGERARVFRDESKTWVDVVDDVRWIDDGRAFLWISERDGWRHVYRVPFRGAARCRRRARRRSHAPHALRRRRDRRRRARRRARVALLHRLARRTPRSAISIASPLDGTGTPERVTPGDQPGTHGYDLAPGGRLAFHTVSRFDAPPRPDVVELPSHQVAAAA